MTVTTKAAPLAPRSEAATNNNNFKARPVNRKILESAGDLGVPRINKKAPTIAKEFNLSSRSTNGASARKKVDVPDELSRPVFSSFGKSATPRMPKPAAPSKPRSVPVEKKPAAVPAALQKAKKAPIEVAAVPAAVAAAPVEVAAPATEIAAPAAEVVAVVEATSAAAAAQEEEEWVMVPEASRVPTGKRRFWAKDALPGYFAAEDAEDEEEDADYVESVAVSMRRTWQVDALPDYMAGAEEDEDEEEDADYVPTPKPSKVRKVAAPVAVVEAAPAGPPPTILHSSMAKYVMDLS